MSLPLRTEVQALVRVRPVFEEFAPSFVPGPGCGLICSVLSSRARACRRNHQVPRVPLPDVGVTSIRETCTVSSEDITPRSSLLQTHSSIPCSSPLLRPFGLVRGVFAGCYQPLLLPGFSRRYLCESFLGCLVPCPGGPTDCLCLFLRLCHRPTPGPQRIGFPLLPAKQLFRGSHFETADIPLRSSLRVCSPPRLFLPLCIQPHGS